MRLLGAVVVIAVLVLIVAALAGYPGLPGRQRPTARVSLAAAPETSPSAEELERAHELLRQRLSASGLRRAELRREGAGFEVIVEDLSDLDERLRWLVTRGEFTLHHLDQVRSEADPTGRLELQSSGGTAGPPEYRFFDLDGEEVPLAETLAAAPVILSSADLRATASADLDPQGMPIVQLELNESGRRRFAEFTRAHVGHQLALVVDGELLSAPVLRAPIEDGEIPLETGFQGLGPARSLAAALNSGPLPFPLAVRSVER